MIPPSLLKSAILCSLAWTALPAATNLARYREFQFGASLPAVAKQAGLNSSEAKIVHQRPALIQELDWQPGFRYQSDSRNTDPVREGLLRFYNGELFQIVVTYDPERVEGMTAADMVQAISLNYGNATKPAVEIPYHSNYGETAPVIARWENAELCFNLVRTGDQASFALIVNLKRLEALAQASIVEAKRLDALEAPQRAIDMRKKEALDSRLQLDKARSVNIPNFRP